MSGVIDIGLCTFRRPQLTDTLASLAALQVPEGYRLRVIVADNDAEPSAQPQLAALVASYPHELVYRHAPAANISIARNACLDAAEGRFMAFIDDDEIASPQWLAALLETALADAADAVLGPVRAIYAASAPVWMRQGDFHSTLPVYVDGRIVTGYTCNVLFDRQSPAVAGRRFDLALGKSGGEDTAFFTGLVRDGGRIAFAAEAWVEEAVPEKRAQFGWLARRRFRMGQTHGRVVIGPGGLPRQAAQMAKAGAKAGYCYALAALALPVAHVSRRYALRGTLHAGVVAGLAGLREIEQYGGPVQPERSADAS